MAAAAQPSTLIIGCGALAREMVSFIDAAKLDAIAVTCLPAHLHNRPHKIPAILEQKIRQARRNYDRVFVLYGDCGTGGEIDRVCARHGVERIDGSHCYEFYAGREDFKELTDAEPACFFLTDYLVRHFKRLIVTGLGLDRHPELRDDYFGNYKKLVYLAQTDDPALTAKAERAADFLGLAFERRFTGLGELADFMKRAASA